MSARTVSAWGQLIGTKASSEEAYSPGEERRVWVRYVCDAPAMYQPAHKPSADALQAKVRNISRGGVSLHLDRSFDRGAILSIELQGPNSQVPVTLLACVVHIEQLADLEWVVGCSFVTELVDDELEPFGARRARPSEPDQRGWVRFACDMQATYRQVKASERALSSAKVIDISAAGVGLLVNRQIEIGSLLNMELRGPKGQSFLKMLGCVVRVSQRGPEEWALGCNFIREISDRELNDLVNDRRRRSLGDNF